MKAKIILFASILTICTLLMPLKTQAQEKASVSSATFNDVLGRGEGDNRVAILQKYLEKNDSPLAPYASTFVAQADLYGLDYRLLPSIAGTESTFAKQEPLDCYNSWGFGIYGTQVKCFDSYDQAIRVIAQTLRERYINGWGAQDVYEIGHYYAASPTWADHVTFFMNQIQNFALLPENQPLSISL